MGDVPVDLGEILLGLRVGLGDQAEVLSGLFWGMESWLFVLVCLYFGWFAYGNGGCRGEARNQGGHSGAFVSFRGAGWLWTGAGEVADAGNQQD